MESDPIGLAGGSYSTYVYGGNNPISNVDPDGLQEVIPTPEGPIILPPVPGSTANQQYNQARDAAAIALQDTVSNAVDAIINAAKAAKKAIQGCFSKESDDAREKRCQDNLDRDLETCASLSKRDGKSAYAICARQAHLRYGNCLSGRDSGIEAPLPPWGTK